MSSPDLVSAELATFLAQQLGPLAASSGFVVSTDGPDVVVAGTDGHESRNGTAAILGDADDPRTPDDRAATVARAVLGHVQDAIARETGKPWPGAGSDLPVAGAAVENGELVAWFGDRDAPAWRSDGLPLVA
jgi:hypothetical protein